MAVRFALKRNPLPLPAGELMRVPIRQRFKLHQIQQFLDALSDFRLPQPLCTRPDAQAERHVLEDSQVTEQRVMLKYESDVTRFNAFAALAGVDLEIKSGELVALLGPSGSGKTTLLRIIAGLEWPEEGQVLFDGEDSLARSVGERVPHLDEIPILLTVAFRECCIEVLPFS